MLIGHQAERAAFTAAWTSGRMPHAWLLTGPEGVGKASFADTAATMLLAGAQDFDVDALHPAARLIAAGSHPDLKRLVRLPRDGDGRLAAAIAVDQVRALQPLFQMTPGLGGWRVVIVDPIDALNPSAANALLKNLEEPPARTVFLCISHAPGRLLPTLRSRCRKLRFSALSDADTGRVLAAAGVADAERATLVRLAGGAPGRALRFAGLAIGGLQDTLDGLARATPAHARAHGRELARALASKTAQPRYEAFLDLAPRYLVRAAGRRRGAALAATLALWEEARDLAAEAGPRALDPAAVVVELARLVAATPPEHP